MKSQGRRPRSRTRFSASRLVQHAIEHLSMRALSFGIRAFILWCSWEDGLFWIGEN